MLDIRFKHTSLKRAYKVGFSAFVLGQGNGKIKVIDTPTKEMNQMNIRLTTRGITLAVVSLIAAPSFAAGLVFGQADATPSSDELNESAKSLCYEIGGVWRTDFNGGWCNLS